MLGELSLKGKNVLVTGAGRGIGTGIADVLAEAGATVVMNSLTDRFVGPFAEKLEKRTGSRIVVVAGDMSHQAGVFAVFDKAVAAVGPLDVVISNLGDSIPTPMLRARLERVE